jgi:hypothetical protein
MTLTMSHLSSSAVFEKRDLSKRKKNQEAGSDETFETRFFPFPTLNGFGFTEKYK